MTETLILRLPRSADESASWLRANAQGVALSGVQQDHLSAAAVEAAGRKLCVLVSAEDVLIADVELPVKGGARALQVAPYALEDQLAGDIDEQHFALGQRDAGTARTRVAVTRKELMSGWLQQLEAAGLRPDQLLPELSLLPVNPGQSVAVLEHGNLCVLLAGGATAPATLPADDLAAALAVALGTAPLESQHLLLYIGADEWRARQREIEQLRSRLAGLHAQVLDGGSLPLLATQVYAPQAVNLLQGEFAPRHSAAVEWRRWRLAAALAGGVILLFASAQLYARWQLSRAETQLDDNLSAISARHFGGTVPPADLRGAAEQRLLAGQSGGDVFLPALEALSVAAAGTGAQLEAVSFREQAVDLKLRAPDAQSLERIAQNLRAAGWQAELTAGNARGDVYEGRVQLRPAKS